MVKIINNKLNDIQELKAQLLKGTFYYYNDTLLIRSKVKYVHINNYMIHVEFECGAVTIEKDKIKPIRRPGNVIAKFSWCYILKSCDNECIGYIGQVKQ